MATLVGYRSNRFWNDLNNFRIKKPLDVEWLF